LGATARGIGKLDDLSGPKKVKDEGAALSLGAIVGGVSG
jgi:hypothetical protein